MNYIVLSRTLYYIPYLTRIHPGRILSTFVGLDAVVGILTGNGASRSASTTATPSEIKLGANLVRASILLQVGCLVGLLALEVLFHRRCVRVGIIR